VAQDAADAALFPWDNGAQAAERADALSARFPQAEGELLRLPLVEFKVPAGEQSLEPAEHPFKAAGLVQERQRTQGCGVLATHIAVVGAQQVREHE